MIDGITVLAQETITPIVGDIVAYFVFAGIFLVLGIICLVVALLDRETIYLGLMVITLFMASFLGGMGASELSKDPYIKYKVLIDQDTSWSAVYDNYEIIDQEGQIYTIKEKE